MLRLFVLALIQSALIACGQVTLKLALQKMAPLGFNWEFVRSVVTNWQFGLSGLTFGGGSLLWMYIIKHYPMSVAYPLGSMSYVICMLMSIFFLNENIDYTKWIGVFLIMAGCAFIAK